MSNSKTSSSRIPASEPRRWLAYCALFLLASWPATARLIQAVSPEASDAPQTAEQVIGAYVSALGGKEALAQITSRKAEGRVEMANRKEGGQKFITYWRAPDFSRMRVESDGEDIELGFDGKAGWRSEYVGVIERVSGRSLELLLRDANPLRYARLAELYPDVTLDREPPEDAPKGTGLIYRGREETLRFYFDPKSHLLTEITAEGAKDETGPRHYLFEDYRKVDGVLFPFAIREIVALPNADPRAVHIEHIVRYHKLQQNINIPESMFSPPR
jgi:hypothetical protein